MLKDLAFIQQGQRGRKATITREGFGSKNKISSPKDRWIHITIEPVEIYGTNRHCRSEMGVAPCQPETIADCEIGQIRIKVLTMLMTMLMTPCKIEVSDAVRECCGIPLVPRCQRQHVARGHLCHSDILIQCHISH